MDSLPTEPQGSPRILEWVAYPFSSGFSRPRNRTGVSRIAGEFFTNWAIRVTLCIKEIMRTYYIAQETPLSTLCWPKWEGNPKKEGVCDCLQNVRPWVWKSYRNTWVSYGGCFPLRKMCISFLWRHLDHEQMPSVQTWVKAADTEFLFSGSRVLPANLEGSEATLSSEGWG